MVAATLKAMAQTEPEAVALALSLVKVGKNFFKTSPNLLKLLKRNKKKCWTTKLHPTFQLYGDEWIMTEFHLKWTLFKWQIMELLLLWSNQKMCVCLRCELTAIAHQNYIYMTKQKSLLGNISSVRYLKKIAWEKWFQREQQQWGVTVRVTGCAPLNPQKCIQLYCALLSCGKLLTLCAAWNQITVEIISDWPLHWNNIWVCLAALQTDPPLNSSVVFLTK